MIDRINILQATKLAMTDALRRMPQQPDHLVIDALSLRDVDLPQRPIIDGDAISASIAAASIVAKVTRDRLHRARRATGVWVRTQQGLRNALLRRGALNEGPCEWHRRSFAPLRLLLAGEQLSLDLLFDDQMPTEDDFDPDDELAPEELIRPSRSPKASIRGRTGRRRLSVIHCSPPTGGDSWPRQSNGSGAVRRCGCLLADEPGLARARARWRSVAGDST